MSVVKIHPLLSNPQSVLISVSPVSEPASWEDFRLAAVRAMAAMQIELDGEKAVIKPNLTSAERFADPDSGITTHPSFVQGMVEYLRDHGVRRRGTYVLEDPRNSDDNEPRHWRGTGFRELSDRFGVKLRCTKTYTCVKKVVPNPLTYPMLNVSRLAVSTNTVLFNVPKLKTHNLGITTLCMKNLMGTVNVFDRHFCGQAWREMPEEMCEDKRPRKEWMDRVLHEQIQAGLARRLADTAKVVQPDLNIVEGVVGREGTGFQQGKNRALGLVVAGINMVAVDSVTSYLAGFDPQKLVYLEVAAQAGLGTNDLSDLALYTVVNGAVVPCQNIDDLRACPPFRVISGIKGEKDWEEWSYVAKAQGC
jgi:uncharacterized protein (DUF362 family)